MPDALSTFFSRAAARLGLAAGARGAVLALGAGLPLIVLRWTGALHAGQLLTALAIALVVVVAMMIWWSPRRPADVAAEVESRTRAAKNLLVTAAEIDARRTPLRDDVRDVARMRRAAAGSISPSFFRGARSAGIAAFIVARVSVDSSSAARARDRGREAAPEISTVTVLRRRRQAPRTVDPERVDALPAAPSDHCEDLRRRSVLYCRQRHRLR